MDEKQIKKKIEEKIDKWDGITFFTLFFLLIIIPFILSEIIPTTIGLYIILILGFIALTAFIASSTYVYDLVEERYDEFIEREEYWQKHTLKEKILDIFTIIWIISPILVLLDIFAIPLYPIKGIIFGIILVGFWLLGPFILGKKDEEEHSR